MKTHRPLLFITASLGLGILFSVFNQMSFKWTVFVTLSFIILSFVLFMHKRISTALFYCFIFCFGLVLSQSYQVTPNNHYQEIVRYYYGHIVGLKGIIISDVEDRRVMYGEKKQFTMEVREFKTKWGWRKKIGRILINNFNKLELLYGDEILIEGKIHRPFEFSSDTNFSYRKYLQYRKIRYILSVKKNSNITVIRRGEGFWLKSVSFNLRKKLRGIFHQYLTINEAGIMQALILGDRGFVPKHVRTLFEQTGTAHILAISGMHVGVVAFIFFLFFKLFRLSRRLQLGLTILLVIGYSFLTGGRPSVVRATIMSVVFLSSWMMERETDAINTLSLAALILLIFNPMNLFDIGFQMSFSSVLSIILFYPVFERLWKRIVRFRLPKFTFWIIQSIIVSLSASLGVGGFIVYYFGIVTPISIVANILIIPAISALVSLGITLLAVGLLLPSLAVMVGLCVKAVLSLMVLGVFFLSSVPGGYFYTKNVNIWYIVGYYIFVVILYQLCRRFDR